MICLVGPSYWMTSSPVQRMRCWKTFLTWASGLGSTFSRFRQARLGAFRRALPSYWSFLSQPSFRSVCRKVASSWSMAALSRSHCLRMPSSLRTFSGSSTSGGASRGAALGLAMTFESVGPFHPCPIALGRGDPRADGQPDRPDPDRSDDPSHGSHSLRCSIPPRPTSPSAGSGRDFSRSRKSRPAHPTTPWTLNAAGIDPSRRPRPPPRAAWPRHSDAPPGGGHARPSSPRSPSAGNSRRRSSDSPRSP